MSGTEGTTYRRDHWRVCLVLMWLSSSCVLRVLMRRACVRVGRLIHDVFVAAYLRKALLGPRFLSRDGTGLIGALGNWNVDDDGRLYWISLYRLFSRRSWFVWDLSALSWGEVGRDDICFEGCAYYSLLKRLVVYVLADDRLGLGDMRWMMLRCVVYT